MLRYIVRRLIFSAALILGVSVLLFALISAIGNPVQVLMAETPGIDPAAVAALSHYYGLDGGLMHRYFTWLFALLRGDFGTSIIYNQPVGGMLWSWGLETLKIQVPAILLALVFAMEPPSSPPPASTAAPISPSSAAPCWATRCPASSSASC
jgi:ABC-type dipeptide/oligopeptide/nickel transport system permease component